MDVIETRANRVLMHSGVASGKSHCMGVVSYDFITGNPEVRGFIGANTYGQLTKATLDRIFKVWADIFGFKKGVHYVVDNIPPENYIIIGEKLKSYENTISFFNGGLIFLASLDNYKVIDGTEFGWALLDETKDTKEAAVKEVIIARLRQKGMMVGSNGSIFKTRKYNPQTKSVDDLLQIRLDEGVYRHDRAENRYFKGDIELTGYNPLYIFTSPAKARWLMEWFHLDEDAETIEKCIYSKTDYYRRLRGNQLVVISSTYHNEDNLPPNYIQGLIDDLAGSDGRVKMLIYGSPFGKTGGEYYHAYSRLKHVKTFEPWKDEPIHLMFDFNVVPYMTCLCGQMKFNNETGRYLVRIFREFCLSNPDNNTPALCRTVIRELYPWLQGNTVFYYGDYTGKNRQTITEEYKNQYSVIEHFFAQWLTNTSDRVIPNLLNITRRDFMNKVFNGTLPIDLEIHESCKELRGDCEFVKEDPNGAKLKTKINVDGVSFEEHGHTSDSLESFLCSAFNNLLTQNK